MIQKCLVAKNQELYKIKPWTLSYFHSLFRISVIHTLVIFVVLSILYFSFFGINVALFCCMITIQMEELWVHWLALAKLTQNISINLKETFMFICMQKINLRYCKHITNFLFVVLWACLATSIKKDNTNW